MKTTFISVEKDYSYWGAHFTAKLHIDFAGGIVGKLIVENNTVVREFYEALGNDKDYLLVKDDKAIIERGRDEHFLDMILDGMAYIEKERRNKE